MTPKQRELVAKLEARLRGWRVCKEQTMGGPWLTPRNELEGLGEHGECRAAADPTTPSGAWEWRRLLHLSVYETPYKERAIQCSWPNLSRHGIKAGSVREESDLAAVTAAVIAAAEKEV